MRKSFAGERRIENRREKRAEGRTKTEARARERERSVKRRDLAKHKLRITRPDFAAGPDIHPLRPLADDISRHNGVPFYGG